MPFGSVVCCIVYLQKFFIKFPGIIYSRIHFALFNIAIQTCTHEMEETCIFSTIQNSYDSISIYSVFSVGNEEIRYYSLSQRNNLQQVQQSLITNLNCFV